MKARIRKTGEVVDVISWNGSTIRCSLDNVSYIDSQGVEHDRASLNYYWDFELIDAQDENKAHWQDVRKYAAIAAMQGLLAHDGVEYLRSNVEEYIAICSLRLADELVKQLHNKPLVLDNQK